MSPLHFGLPPAIATAIRNSAYFASRRLRRYGYTREDVHQEFTLHWIRRRAQYDPQRSSTQTFATRICHHRGLSLLAAETADKRGSSAVYSYSELPTIDQHGRAVERPEHVSTDAYQMRLGIQSRSAAELAALRLDVSRVNSDLPAGLKDIVRLMAQGEPVGEIAAALGISRATLHRRVTRLREIFRSAGLAEYVREGGRGPKEPIAAQCPCADVGVNAGDAQVRPGQAELESA
jgi:RNA polymerase sigma-70 factor (ECF subfamily)